MTQYSDSSKVEIPGTFSVGQRFWQGGKVFEVKAVHSVYELTQEILEDLADYTRRPGTYSVVTLEESAPRPEDGEDPAARARAEKAERRAKAQAEAAEYLAKLDALLAERDAIVAEHGLVRDEDEGRLFLAEQCPGVEKEFRGRACQPNRGISDCTDLEIHRHGGRVVAISYGCPVDSGPTFWALPELIEGAAKLRRIWKWWSPNYGAERYDGPGVPRKQLTADELAEVQRLERAKKDAEAEKIRQDLERAPGLAASSLQRRLVLGGWPKELTVRAEGGAWGEARLIVTVPVETKAKGRRKPIRDAIPTEFKYRNDLAPIAVVQEQAPEPQ